MRSSSSWLTSMPRSGTAIQARASGCRVRMPGLRAERPGELDDASRDGHRPLEPLVAEAGHLGRRPAGQVDAVREPALGHDRHDEVLVQVLGHERQDRRHRPGHRHERGMERRERAVPVRGLGPGAHPVARPAEVPGRQVVDEGPDRRASPRARRSRPARARPRRQGPRRATGSSDRAPATSSAASDLLVDAPLRDPAREARVASRRRRTRSTGRAARAAPRRPCASRTGCCPPGRAEAYSQRMTSTPMRSAASSNSIELPHDLCIGRPSSPKSVA